MSHKHFCDVAGHWWECNGKAMRSGNAERSVCICLPCGRPLEGFDHSSCDDPVELLACPDHHQLYRRHVEEVKKGLDRQRAEFGLEQKLAKLQSLPDGPEKDSLNKEVADWVFRLMQG
jgi:hypothetical protein